ncbi:unnamed protein product [Ilex paraguariensis]|uniref:Uncharacterized protein n=1 Tax=Ilex paraguariensis TaxID=185542 RepID=A0ABC8SHQ4_9AQUA
MVKVAEADRRARGGVEPLMTMGKGSSEKGTIAIEEICDGWQSQREDFEIVVMLWLLRKWYDSAELEKSSKDSLYHYDIDNGRKVQTDEVYGDIARKFIDDSLIYVQEEGNISQKIPVMVSPADVLYLGNGCVNVSAHSGDFLLSRVGVSISILVLGLMVHGENRHLRCLGEPGSGLLGVPLITAYDPIFKIDDRCPIINVGLMNSDAVTTETIVSFKGERNR